MTSFPGAVRRIPTLFVGAGGTGITTARIVKTIGRKADDSDLFESIRRGAFQFVGVDTDRNANTRRRDFDPSIIPTDSLLAGGQQVSFTSLDQLEGDQFVALSARSIANALNAINADATLIQAGGGLSGLRHPEIAAWFPGNNTHDPNSHRDTQSTARIGYGAAAANGAAQWRPLGRVGLFLSAGAIFAKLRSALERVQSALDNQSSIHAPPRAYIISSLAGGTGSGMFWDLAYMLRTLNPELDIRGIFLHPAAFDGLDQAGRIYANGYAAIKELVMIKNWTWDVPHEFRWPGVPATYMAQSGAAPAFNSVYLFPGISASEAASDIHRARVDLTCLRMAEVCLAQTRDDLYADLDQGNANERSDSRELSGQPGARYVFSTAGAAQFEFPGEAEIQAATYLDALPRLVHDNESPSNDKDSLTSRLKGGDPVRLIAGIVESMDRNQAALTKWAEQLDGQSISEDPVRRFQERIPQIVRRRWADAVATAATAQPTDHALFSPEELHGDALVGAVEELCNVVSRHIARISEDRSLLSREDRKASEKVIEWLNKLPRDSQRLHKMLIPPQYIQGFSDLQRAAVPRPFLFGWIFRMLDWIGRFGRRQILSDMVDEIIRSTMLQVREIGDAKADDVTTQLSRSLSRTGQLDVLLSSLKRVVEIDDRNRERRQQLRHAIDIERSRLQLDDTGERSPMLLDHLASIGEEIRRLTLDEMATKDLVADAVEIWQDVEKHVESGVANNPRSVSPNPAFWRDLFKDASPTDGKTLVECLAEAVTKRVPFFDIDDAGTMLSNLIVWRSVFFTVLRAWTRRQEVALARLGSETGIEGRLTQVDTPIFTSGSLTNPISIDKVVLVPPERTHIAVMPLDLNATQSVERAFKNHAGATLQTEPSVSRTGSDLPILYMEKRSRSVDEIKGIEELRRSYIDLSLDVRPLYHILHGIADAPDVATASASPFPVKCGNVGCERDLRYDSRMLTNCAECSQPIWNRCGNEQCAEDNLRNRLLRENGGVLPKRLPNECPECNHELLTYWWRCAHHPDMPIPADKSKCPNCLAEYQAGNRQYSTVAQRSDADSTECPGCEQLGAPQAEVTIIPSSLRKFYFDGVNGHDSVTFPELVQKHKLKPHECGYPAHRHFLFPTCPEPSEDGAYHNLYRGPHGQFICPNHPAKRFFSCFHCDYPIDSDDHNLRADGTTTCPRCLRGIRVCTFCTPQNQHLFEPQPQGSSQRLHCPNCSNLVSPIRDRAATLDLNEDFRPERPGYCPNTTGCDAGAAPWDTVARYDIGTCRICDSAQLLNRSELVENISRCPVCVSVFGTPTPTQRTPTTIPAEPDDLREHFDSLKAQRPYALERLNERCETCGTIPSRMLSAGNIALDDEDLDDDRFPAADATVEIGLQPFSVIFEVLLRNRDDLAALDALKEIEIFRAHRGDIRELMSKFLDPVDTQSAAGRSLERRFDAVAALHEEEMRRESGGRM